MQWRASSGSRRWPPPVVNSGSPTDMVPLVLSSHDPSPGAPSSHSLHLKNTCHNSNRHINGDPPPLRDQTTTQLVGGNNLLGIRNKGTPNCIHLQFGLTKRSNIKRQNSPYYTPCWLHIALDFSTKIPLKTCSHTSIFLLDSFKRNFTKNSPL